MTGRAADDANVGYFTLVLRFAVDHEFTTDSFTLFDARGSEYEADPDRSVISSDRALLQFPTAVGADSATGWRLAIEGPTGLQSLLLSDG